MRISKKFSIFSALVLGLFLALNFVAAGQADRLIHNPLSARPPLRQTPADAGLDYRDVSVVTSDNLELHGWFIPGTNSALVMMQHGYKVSRTLHLEEAAMFARAGYNVLVTSVRAHDVNPGDTITFGHEEMKDLDAWYHLALTLPGIDPERIGMLGNSLGGSLVIEYAAENTGIAAVVAHSAFSSMRDTIETSVRHFTGLPAFPFAPLIRFWAERELGFSIDDIDAKQWIGRISPRPVLIIHSLDDTVISPDSGQLLYEAAGEPKSLWQEHGITHADFDTAMPEEFERRVVGFFDAAFFPAAAPAPERSGDPL